MSDNEQSASADATADQDNSLPLPQELDTPESRLDPFPWFEKMRETNPVRYDPYREVWDVFRYEDINEILETGPPEWSSSLRPAEALEGTPFEPMLQSPFRDPPVHDRITDALGEFFEPAALRSHSEDIRAIAERQVDEVLAAGSGFDFRQDLVKPIPVNTICSLFGIPPEKHEDVRQWSRFFIAAQRTPEDDTGVSEAETGDSVVQMFSYFDDLIAEKRADPADDILSGLVQMEVNGEPLRDDELKGMLLFSIVAGNTTTISSLTGTVWTLAEEGLLQEFIDGEFDRQLLLDEVLRYRGPAKTLSRKPTSDVELRGETIPAGDRVELWLLSADRDEAVFDDPDSFVPDRRPNPHLAFGRGIHYCLGAPLFRLEAEITFDVLFDRIESMDVDTTSTQPINSFSQYGTRTLQVTVEQ
jgi:cytochrome P450